LTAQGLSCSWYSRARRLCATASNAEISLMASSTKGFFTALDVSPPRARSLASEMWVRTKEGYGRRGCSTQMSSTHNESRLAACPLSGVPGRVRAPCQLILRRVGKCAALFGRAGRGCQLL
jgi:hypothetical protein